MTRKAALTAITVAGYHGDHRWYLRLYVEHRIIFAVAQQAYRHGEQLRQSGMTCSCRTCAENRI